MNIRCVVALFLLVPTTAASACVSDSPAGTAQWVYRHNSQLDNPAAISRRLALLMRKERACVAQSREVCTLDWNFWTSGQDGQVFGGAPRFEVASSGPSRATVRMKYRFALYEDGRDAAGRVTTLRLTRNSPQGCWMIDDIVDPAGRSLKDALSAG